MIGLLAFLAGVVLDQALLDGEILRAVLGLIPGSWQHLQDAASTVKDAAK